MKTGVNTIDRDLDAKLLVAYNPHIFDIMTRHGLILKGQIFAESLFKRGEVFIITGYPSGEDEVSFKW